ncbi:MAG: WD40/YVTN/BNR-like repeat-containing protein, partial [Candidatus Dormibacteria bacterium]
WQTVTPATQVAQTPGAVGGLPESCPGGGPLSAPTFADAERGWLGAFCDREFLYATRDGGLSWTPQPLPAFPGPASTVPAGALQYDTDSPQFVAPAVAVVFVHRGMTSGANALEDAAIVASHDGGASWNATRLPAAELQAGFVDAAHGWMVAAGPNGATDLRSLYTSADAGVTWAKVSGPQDYFSGSVGFVTPTLGFIGGSEGPAAPGLLLRTSDAGATWAPVVTAVP